MPPEYTITLHDPREDSDEAIAERVAFTNARRRVVFPDDQPLDVAQEIAVVRAMPSRHRVWAFRARDADGVLVGTGGAAIDPANDSNPDVLWGNVNVLPEHRRRGLGSQLLAELVGVALQQERTRMLGDTNERIPAGAEFAMVMGAAAKQADHLNHLPMAEVDRALLERWVGEAARRAADYEVIAFDNRVPDDLMDAFVDLVLVMNTAPRDSLELNDFTLTAAELREEEATLEAAGMEEWTLVARHVATGELAGFHDVSWSPSNPTVMWVGATGVKPDHRGHALGKWLKAAMTLRILDEKPGVADVRTGNADSNEAMLGINRLMGYRPMIAHTTWEIRVDHIEKLLIDNGFAPTLVV